MDQTVKQAKLRICPHMSTAAAQHVATVVEMSKSAKSKESNELLESIMKDLETISYCAATRCSMWVTTRFNRGKCGLVR